MHMSFVILVYFKKYLLLSWTRGCRRPTSAMSISLSFRHYSFTPLCWIFLYIPFQLIQSHPYSILLTALFIRQWEMFQFLTNYYKLQYIAPSASESDSSCFSNCEKSFSHIDSPIYKHWTFRKSSWGFDWLKDRGSANDMSKGIWMLTDHFL